MLTPQSVVNHDRKCSEPWPVNQCSVEMTDSVAIVTNKHRGHVTGRPQMTPWLSEILIKLSRVGEKQGKGRTPPRWEIWERLAQWAFPLFTLPPRLAAVAKPGHVINVINRLQWNGLPQTAELINPWLLMGHFIWLSWSLFLYWNIQFTRNWIC